MNAHGLCVHLKKKQPKNKCVFFSSNLCLCFFRPWSNPGSVVRFAAILRQAKDALEAACRVGNYAAGYSWCGRRVQTLLAERA